MPPLDPNVPMRIRKVTISGNARTKPEVFENELQNAYHAETFGEIAMHLQHAAIELKRLDIFDTLDFQLDAAHGGDRSEMDVRISVKEKNWRRLSMNATTDGQEETVETSLILNNAIGAAEHLTLKTTRALTGSYTMEGHFRKPRLLGLPLYLRVQGSTELHNWEKHSSYNEHFTGGSVSISDYDGFHDLSLLLGWRDVVPRRHTQIPYAFNASPSILAEAKPSTKTSLKYTYREDSRDNPVMPSAGKLFVYSSELAGLFGDVNFIKTEVEAQQHLGFGPMMYGKPLFSLGLASHLGLIKNYGADAKRPARISDRFFLGGPMNLRGFDFKGVGPRASPSDGGALTGDALGGEVMYSLTASLGFPLPLDPLASLGFRGHAFANIGNLLTWERLLDEKKWLRNMVDDTRVTVGVGIVWATVMGRLEANYSWALRSLQQDNRKRVQFGLGLSFS